jgi:hypothetical protein
MSGRDDRQTYRTPDGEEHVVDAHECESGWIGEDHLGRSQPCLTCHPRLRRRRDDEAGIEWLDSVPPQPASGGHMSVGRAYRDRPPRITNPGEAHDPALARKSCGRVVPVFLDHRLT